MYQNAIWRRLENDEAFSVCDDPHNVGIWPNAGGEVPITVLRYDATGQTRELIEVGQITVVEIHQNRLMAKMQMREQAREEREADLCGSLDRLCTKVESLSGDVRDLALVLQKKE